MSCFRKLRNAGSSLCCWLVDWYVDTTSMASTHRVVHQIDQLIEYIRNTNMAMIRFDAPDSNGATRSHSLSDDAVQLILSFTGLYSMRLVCTRWRDLCLKNEENYFNALYAPYRDKQHYQLCPTLIVHPLRHTLNSNERNSGFQGPFRSIRSALIHATDGDVLLIHEGRYKQFQNECDYINIDVTLIGVGSTPQDVIWEDPSTDSQMFIQIDSAEVHLQNMTIKSTETDHGIQGALFIASRSRLSMTDCILRFHQTGVMVRNEAKLTMTRCCIMDGATGIEISPLAQRVEVSESIFRNLGQITGGEESIIYPAEQYGCILIFDDFGDLNGSVSSASNGNGKHKSNGDNQLELVSLECISNIFEDNLCYPVVERSDDQLYLRSDRYILRQNVLRGFNGTMTRCEGQLDDANKLYHSFWN